ncbi:terpene synthase family protein [Nannocystaceae bacterium ST9]
MANAQWIVDLGLLEANTPAFLKFGAAGFEELAGLVHRDEDFEGLLLAANYITALFFLDDMVDAAGSRVGSEPELVRRMANFMSECVRTGEAPGELSARDWSLPHAHREKLASIGKALADVTRRLAALPHEPDLGHYVREMDEYLEGVVAEADHRRTHAFADVSDYEAVRTKFSAMYACVEFGALLRGLDPSVIARNHRPYRRMVRNTNLCVSYVNDLFSYKKEFLLGECSNLVMVLERIDGLARAAAFRRACRISDLVVVQYMDDKQRCLELDVDARRGMDLMETWMRGNYDWYVGRTFRYVDTLSTHESSSSHPIPT